MNIELKGTIKLISEPEIITEKLTKNQIVIQIEEDTQYPQDILVEAINKKIGELEGYLPNDYVTLTANLRGRENKGKHYISLSMVSIRKG